MTVANYFGADEAAVLLKFATGGYSPTAADFGGSAAIADMLADGETAVIQAMGADLWRNITDPELECVESRGTDGQVTVSCGITPIIVNNLEVWRGMPSSFQRDKPQRQTDRMVEYPGSAGINSPSVVNYGPQPSMPESQYSATTAGVITLAQPLQRGEQVFASYRVNTKDASFSLPSVADLVTTVAAWKIGTKIYPRDDSSWSFVESLKAEVDAMLAALNGGLWTPSEIRLLRWWKPVEKAQENTIGSLRRWRA